MAEIGPVNFHNQHISTRQEIESSSSDTEKIERVAKEILGGGGSTAPSLNERDVTIRHSDLKFIKQLSLDFIIGSLETIEDEDWVRIYNIYQKHPNYPSQGSDEDRAIFLALSELFQDSGFTDQFTVIEKKIIEKRINDLKELENDKKVIEKVKKRKKISKNGIKDVIKIYKNQTLEKCSTHETSKLFKKELAIFINSSFFIQPLLRYLFKDALDLSTLLELINFPFDGTECNPLAIKDSLKYKYLPLQFKEDLAFLENCTFNKLERMFEIDAMSDDGLTQSARVNAFERLNSDFYDDLDMEENLFYDHLVRQIKDENPIRVIKLLQQLKDLSTNKHPSLLKVFKDLEIKTVGNLFTKYEEASNGISQVNFEDIDLNINSGGANFCCGSISVEALVTRLKGKTIEEIIKNGVIRHQRLPAKQMHDFSTISMLLAYNKDILKVGEEKFEMGGQGTIGITRYEKFLEQIPVGSSGIMATSGAAFMYASNLNGSVEIFDSHGSSVPLIVGHTQPAYRAFFENMNNAAAYLSVHRELGVNSSLLFQPISVIESKI